MNLVKYIWTPPAPRFLKQILCACMPLFYLYYNMKRDFILDIWNCYLFRIPNLYELLISNMIWESLMSFVGVARNCHGDCHYLFVQIILTPCKERSHISLDDAVTIYFHVIVTQQGTYNVNLTSRNFQLTRFQHNENRCYYIFWNQYI